MLLNEGKIAMKSRGNKQNTLSGALMEAHKEAVRLQRLVTQQHEDKYQVMTVERYKQTHHMRTPEQDGPSTANAHKDDKCQDVVLLKKAPEGEWTLRISLGDKVTKDKEIADGQAALRDGQLDDVFGGRANALTGAF